MASCSWYLWRAQVAVEIREVGGNRDSFWFLARVTSCPLPLAPKVQVLCRMIFGEPSWWSGVLLGISLESI
jgi:hypothetical protein